MSSSRALFRSMYNKTNIRFGFWDIQNGYQPQPSASADTPYLDLDHSAFHKTSDEYQYYTIFVLIRNMTQRLKKKPVNSESWGKNCWAINFLPHILSIAENRYSLFYLPLGSSKCGTTCKNTQRYYIPTRLITYRVHCTQARGFNSVHVHSEQIQWHQWKQIHEQIKIKSSFIFRQGLHAYFSTRHFN